MGSGGFIGYFGLTMAPDALLARTPATPPRAGDAFEVRVVGTGSGP